MTLNDITNNVVIIHLPHREDRMNHISQQSDILGISAAIFPAVNGQEIENPSRLTGGNYALLLSHGQILNYAKRNNLDKIIILEDDVDFVSDLNERLDNEWPEIPQDADLVYLGANKRFLGAGTIPEEQVTEHVVRLYSAFTTHALVVYSSIYDSVLEKIKRFDAPLDIIYGEIQREYKAYGFTKNLAKQWDSYSDIIGFDPGYQAKGLYD